MATDLYRERDELRSAIANQAHQMSAMSADAQRGRALMSALTDQGAMRVTLSQTPAKAVPQGHASYLPEKGSLIFTASNLDQLQPFKTYELWLIPEDGQPIPAGTFNPDARGNASVIMPQIPRGVVAKAFGVTIENEGGSQVPTMPIILSGE
jgi:anti-sigma-K factor RskA